MHIHATYTDRIVMQPLHIAFCASMTFSLQEKFLRGKCVFCLSKFLVARYLRTSSFLQQHVGYTNRLFRHAALVSFSCTRPLLSTNCSSTPVSEGEIERPAVFSYFCSPTNCCFPHACRSISSVALYILSVYRGRRNATSAAVSLHCYPISTLRLYACRRRFIVTDVYA
jgi:hypothetical protein